jgi:hypothetical protein
MKEVEGRRFSHILTLSTDCTNTNHGKRKLKNVDVQTI